jgi:small subunit ribosomal protein S8
MSMSDPIADLLTRIRNGVKAKKTAVDVPASNMKREIVRLLIESKYVKDVVEIPDNRQGILRVYLRYSADDLPVLRGITRLSRPGLRKYFTVENMKQSTQYQRGILIVSTSRGLMTNRDALKMGVGGEAVLRCW